MKSLGVLLLLFTVSAAAQNMSVKIVQRQSSESPLSYNVPAHYDSTSTDSATCNAYGSSATCNGSSTTSGYVTGSRLVSYSVTGATFTLLLPDGRYAVVNCVSKYRPKGDYINRRSCRTPVVDNIEAKFSGKSAKLKWPVSLDGKKFDSETYMILGVFPK